MAWIILVFAVAIGFSKISQNAATAKKIAKENHRLAVQNRKRIKENRDLLEKIQQSRVSSCVQTYGSFTEILLDPQINPRSHTEQEKAIIKKFKRVVHNKQENCIKQTGLGGP